jgi:hypothetical protein
MPTLTPTDQVEIKATKDSRHKYVKLCWKLGAALALARSGYSASHYDGAGGIGRDMRFIRGLFSDDGKASFSRFRNVHLLLGTLFWVSYLVVKKETMPDLASPDFVTGLAVASIKRLQSLKDSRND